MDEEEIAEALAMLKAQIFGQHVALAAFVAALLSTHPDPSTVLRRFDRFRQLLQDPALFPELDEKARHFAAQFGSSDAVLAARLMPAADPH